MPTNRRRRLQRQRPDIVSPRTIQRLESGHDFDALFDGPDLTEEELREAWEQLRETILADFIAKNPGRRPWAWWEYDAPEPRRQIAPGPKPVGDDRWFGMPRCYRGVPPPEMYESEADYLDRLELLTDQERETLARQSSGWRQS